MQYEGAAARKRRRTNSVTREGDDDEVQGGEAAASVLKGQPQHCVQVPVTIMPSCVVTLGQIFAGGR